ncbi:MAG: DUF1573 domain-containing protein [Phycisphaeraceae bacterium]|nr:DUF1573 domain-containing protein [Phycisphaeraceae bacterium]
MLNKQLSERVWFIVIIFALAVTQLASAQLAWEQREVELDSKLGDEAVEAVFRFTNEGDQPVTITSIKSSCGCATADLEEKVYKPGDSGQVDARFILGDRVGSQSKRIVVRTDSEDSPITTLTIKVDIPEVMRIRPRLVYWRVGEAQDPKTVHIEVMQQEPEVRILHAQTSSDAISAKLQTKKDGKSYELILTPNENAGVSNVTVRLVTDLPQEEEESFRGFRVLARLLPRRSSTERTDADNQPLVTDKVADDDQDTMAPQTEEPSVDSEPTRQ